MPHREQGSMPGAEVLRRERHACGLSQVFIDVRGTDRFRLSVAISILEKDLPGQIARALHNCRKTSIAHIDFVFFAAFALEAEPNPPRTDGNVITAKRGQSVG